MKGPQLVGWSDVYPGPLDERATDAADLARGRCWVTRGPGGMPALD